MKWLKRLLGFKDENDESFLPENPRTRERWKEFAKKEGMTYKQVRQLFKAQLKEIPLRLKSVPYARI
ncbi:MAG: hypothetical protein WC460_05540 [Patescibacteria group bacterium]